MIWNNKFKYPKSSRSIENGMRKYLFDDEKLPSVTSILQATKSEEDKAALENWKQRVGYKEANKIKTEATPGLSDIRIDTWRHTPHLKVPGAAWPTHHQNPCMWIVRKC